MAKREYCWCFALLVALTLLLLSHSESSENESESGFVVGDETLANANMINGDKPCDEVYMVRNGETLQTISAKCEDPFILENNPHIYDPDDVYPGLVLMITPFRERSSLK